MQHAVNQHFLCCLRVFVVALHHTLVGFDEHFVVFAQSDFVIGAYRHRKRIFSATYRNAARRFGKSVPEAHFDTFCFCRVEHLFACGTCTDKNHPQLVIERVEADEKF